MRTGRLLAALSAPDSNYFLVASAGGGCAGGTVLSVFSPLADDFGFCSPPSPITVGRSFDRVQNHENVEQAGDHGKRHRQLVKLAKFAVQIEVVAFVRRSLKPIQEASRDFAAQPTDRLRRLGVVDDVDLDLTIRDLPRPPCRAWGPPRASA